YQAPFSDTALNQDLELGFGQSDDVRLRVVFEPPDGDTSHPQSTPRALQPLPRTRGVKHRRSLRLSGECRIEVSNARPESANVEVALRLPDGAQVVRADPLPTSKDGLPTFKVTVPGNGHSTIRFQA